MIAIIAIIGVLIVSELFIERLNKMGWTEYDFWKAGLFNDHSQQFIEAMTFDSHGQLWVNNVNRLSVLAKDGTWKDYPIMNSRKQMGALAVDNENQIWVGGVEGLLVLPPQGTWKKVLTDPITSLAVDQQGQLWAGTDNKISLFAIGGRKDFTPENSELSKLGSRALFVDTHGQVWTTDGVQIDILKPDESWTKNIPINIPPSDLKSVQTLVVDKENRIWVGTYTGLFVCNAGDCIKYKGAVMGLAFDSDNKPWIFSGSGGSDYLLIFDIDQALPASRIQLLNNLQWLKNIIMFILAYFFVIRQLSEKNNLLIGALGGGLISLIMSFAWGSSSLLSPIVLIIAGTLIGLATGAVGKKISNEIVVYIISALVAFITIFACVFIVFGAK
jgi:hypothetical protein